MSIHTRKWHRKCSLSQKLSIRSPRRTASSPHISRTESKRIHTHSICFQHPELEIGSCLRCHQVTGMTFYLWRLECLRGDAVHLPSIEQGRFPWSLWAMDLALSMKDVLDTVKTEATEVIRSSLFPTCRIYTVILQHTPKSERISQKAYKLPRWDIRSIFHFPVTHYLYQMKLILIDTEMTRDQ